MDLLLLSSFSDAGGETVMPAYKRWSRIGFQLLSPLQPRWSSREVRLGSLSVHPHVPSRCQVVHVVLACSCSLIRSLCPSESFGGDPCCATLFFSVPWGVPPGTSVPAVCALQHMHKVLPRETVAGMGSLLPQQVIWIGEGVTNL